MRKCQGLLKRILCFICSLVVLLSVFAGISLTVKAAIVERGAEIKYSSYIPGGTWATHYYTLDGHMAYCIESEKNMVEDGDYGTITEVFSNYPLLCKVLFYGYGGPAYKMGEFFSGYGVTLTDEQAYLYTHIAANYAYGGYVWHGLTEEAAHALYIDEWIRYCDKNVCLPENKHLTGGIVRIATPGGAQKVAYLDSFTFEDITVSLEVKINFGKNKNTSGDATTHNAVYGLFSENGTELQRITLTIPEGSTTASGDFIYTFNTSGTYYVQEISAPEGYLIDNNKYYFSVDIASQSAGSSDPHFTSVNNREITFTKADETPVKGNFTFIKKDSSGNLLEGAGFDVYLKSSLPVYDGKYDYSAATPVCSGLSSDASGVVISPMLDYGTYVVHESVVPVGKLPIADFEVGINSDSTTVNIGDIVDDSIKGQFSFKKVDENGNALKGAGFDVYLKSTLPVNDGKYDYSAATTVCSGLSSDDAGVVSSPMLEYGTYIVHESVVPEGKLPVEDFEVVIESNETIVNIGDKVDKNIKGQFSFTKVDESGNALKGAGFDVYLKSSLPVKDGKYDYSAATPACSRLSSDAAGVVTSPMIEYGTYIVHESVIPVGKLPVDDFEVVINSDSTTVDVGDKVDKNIKGKFSFTKVDEAGNALKGAGFDVYLKSSLNKVGGKYDYDSATPVCQRLTSNANGVVTSPELEYGTYVVHEAVVPEGKLPVDDFEVTIKTNGSNQNLGNKTDKTIRGKFTFHKTDQDSNPLSGAGFDVYLKSSLKIVNGKYDFDSATPVCQRITSDSKGIVTSPKLEYGTYVVHEAVVPEGKLPVEDFEVAIESNETTVNIKDKIDDTIKGQFSFTKVDEKGNALKDAGFDVYLKSSLNKADGKYDYDSATPVCQRLTSNANGVVTSPELEYGTYVVHEAVVPEGKLPVDDFEVTIKTNRSNQNLGNKTDKTIRGKFTFRKTDMDSKPLAGAGFDVYLKSSLKQVNGKYDFDSAKPVCQRITSDSKGVVTSPMLEYGTYVVHESVVPEGKLPVEDFEVAIESNETTVNIKDKIDDTIKGQFSFTKVDEKGNALKGAGFDVYLQSALKKTGDKYDYSSANPICARLISNESGVVTSPELEYGTYVVHEAVVPEGKLSVDDFEVTIKTNGSNQNLGNKTDKTIRGKFTFRKTDMDSKPLAGAGFDVYLKSSLKQINGKYDFDSETPVCQRITSDSQGVVTSPMLEYGTYVVHESVVPEGKLPVEDFEVVIESDETTVNIKDKIDNTVKGQFSFTKVDEKGNALKGAGFDVYLQSSLKKAGDEYDFSSANPVCARLISNESGVVSSPELEYGTYVIHEAVTPKGKLPVADFEVSIISDRTTIDLGEKKDQTIQGRFSLVKKGDDGLPIEGAGFSAYRKSLLALNSDGTYDFTSASPVIISNGGTVLTTDADGKAKSDLLDYDTYVVTESVVPPGYEPCEPFEVQIFDHDVTVDLGTKTDAVIPAKFRIIKKDSESEQLILKGGATFKIFNVAASSYVNIDGSEIFTTDDTGTVTTSAPLPLGEYRIEEIEAPEGYYLSSSTIDIIFDSTLPYTMEGTDKIIKVEFENAPKKGSVKISKSGKGLKGYSNNEFVWTDVNLEGAVYEIHAGEDIYSPDMQGTLLHRKDELIGVLTTDADGTASMGELNIGKYYLVETTAPEGYVTDTKHHEFSIIYNDSSATPVVSLNSISNEKQNIVLKLTKTDAETGKALAGAEFGLYADSEIKTFDGTGIFNKGDLIKTAVSDEQGIIDFKLDLPYAQYKVKELKVPVNYVINETEFVFKAEYPSSEIKEININNSWADKPVRGFAEITKKGETLSAFADGTFIWEEKPLKNAVFNVIAKENIYTFDNARDEKGKRVTYYVKDQVIEEIVTDENGRARTSNLPVGKYYLVETKAPYGMSLDSAPIDFAIEYADQYTPIVLSQKSILNDRQKISLNVSKEEAGSGRKLSGGKFNLIADADIKNYNGEIIVKKGEVIASAGAVEGVIDFGLDLPHSKYSIVEENPPADYYKVSKKYDVDLSYTNSSFKKLAAELIIYDDRLPHFAKVRMKLIPSFKAKGKNNYITEDNGEKGYSILLVSDGSSLPLKTTLNLSLYLPICAAFLLIVCVTMVLVFRRKR